jgi:hypothetical protein
MAQRRLWPRPNHALGVSLAGRIAQRACDFFDFWAIFASLSLLFSIPACSRI